MPRGFRLPSPALVVALLALFVALGGTVYAAKKGRKLDGVAIRVKSMPGNRLKPNSIPGNRLKAGSVSGDRLAPGSIAFDRLQASTLPGTSIESHSITGAQIDLASLGQVPSAGYSERSGYAESAEKAASATDAETALYAVNAITAEKVNGYTAGCSPPLMLFAGSCWQRDHNSVAVEAPTAAANCAQEGGTLPEALQLAAFAKEVTLDAGGEWSSDISNYSGKNLFGVLSVTSPGDIELTLSTNTLKYRCVFPLLHE
jgi:hypothetical protein